MDFHAQHCFLECNFEYDGSVEIQCLEESVENPKLCRCVLLTAALRVVEPAPGGGL